MSPLSWVTHHRPDAADRYRAEGQWQDKTTADRLASEVRLDPKRLVAVGERDTLSVAELDDRARRLAGWLRHAGVGRGDVVSFALPNWTESVVIDAAANLLGAISNPIVPIYRDAEVRFILQTSRSKVVFVPESFRSIHYVEMLERIRPQLPELIHAVVVRGAGRLTYDEIVASARAEEVAPVAPDEPRLLLYTSGTTGRAKGVLHSYNTLACELVNASKFWGVSRGDVIFMASPVTHITGYLYGITMPLCNGTTSLLMERWDADRALELISRHDAIGTVAATPFLQELAASARKAGNTIPSLRFFACGGAPVPPEIVRNATKAFANCAVSRVYGSTEAPTVTLGTMDIGSAVAAGTEGEIVGHEVRIVDAAGNLCAPGHEGEILTRGPEVMLGYLQPEDNVAYDDDGFFHTGDLGLIRADGALVITGRKKDLIIRGGENLSAKEIEDVLHTHPKVREAAIVAMPHQRLGESICAFVIPEGTMPPTLEELTDFLNEAGLARQKFPEHLEIVDALPRTASGKVQKFVLRERAQHLTAEQTR